MEKGLHISLDSSVLSRVFDSRSIGTFFSEELFAGPQKRHLGPKVLITVRHRRPGKNNAPRGIRGDKEERICSFPLSEILNIVRLIKDEKKRANAHLLVAPYATRRVILSGTPM